MLSQFHHHPGLGRGPGNDEGPTLNWEMRETRIRLLFLWRTYPTGFMPGCRLYVLNIEEMPPCKGLLHAVLGLVTLYQIISPEIRGIGSEIFLFCKERPYKV